MTEFPSYAADLWKSGARHYYVGVCLQFIDQQWNMRTIPIALRHIKGRHTKVAVGNLIADCLKPFLGDKITPFGAVLDGGDVASIKETEKALSCTILGHTCICHLLNNAIKRVLDDHLGSNYLRQWRKFVKRVNRSNPLKELWEDCCIRCYEKEKGLQKDTRTRWSSSVVMLQQATKVQQAVEMMWLLTGRRKELKEHHVSFLNKFLS